MADLRQTAVSPHTMQGGQAQAPRGLAATALDPLRRAYQAYQQYVGQPFQQAVRGGVRGYFGLPMMSDADALGREAYRQAEALGYTPGVGMPAGAVRLAAEGMQALPSIAGDIGRVIAGMPSGAGAAQAEDFARYQRSISPSDVSPLTAFHGTPHRFEPTPANPLGEFRAAKIGSGEGAQAYGYGLYFAESPEVAKGYRNVLSDTLEVRGPAQPLEKRAAQMALTFGNNTTEGALKWLSKFEGKGASHTSPAMTPELVRQVKQKFENGTFAQGGSLYTVDIPDSMIEKMLDWDKPLSEQPENVKKALKKLPAFKELQKTAKLRVPEGRNINNWNGSFIHRALQDQAGKSNMTPNEISAVLRQAGIPGIKYLDAGSRGGADGTRNIVVFPGEESKVKILKRE